MMTQDVLMQSEIEGVPVKRGKVRDIYDFGDRLLFVATDRISAFDWILPNGIPNKGRVLTQISKMWFDRFDRFDRFDIPHHLLGMNIDDLPLPDSAEKEMFEGRSMVVKKTEVIPVECVVRGYLSGSGWKEYKQSQSVCGISLPEGLKESDRLPEVIFTPATKAEEGHDENISFDTMCNMIGADLSERLREKSIDIYRSGSDYARERGILIADTKFEFGLLDDEIILIDEVLTPDSSRFWPISQYSPGKGQPSFDKQFVRDWLETTDWDKNSEPPELPDEIVQKTGEKYREAYRILTGSEFRIL